MRKRDNASGKDGTPDQMRQDGEVVYHLFWSQDAPEGSGIYRFRGRYFVCLREERSFAGPSYSLGKALNQSGILVEWGTPVLPDLIAAGKCAVGDEDVGKQDRAWLIDVLTDLIIEEGASAYRVSWDSGGPGAGAGIESIYRFRGLYFSRSEVEGLAGPFQSFDEALREDLLTVSEATTAIESDELSAEAIAPRLVAYFTEEEEQYILTINGETWRITSDTQRQPSSD